MSVLGLIPLRYRIAAVLLGLTSLLGAGTAFYFHIEALGEKKVEAAVAEAVSAQKARDQKDIDHAQASLTALQGQLDGALAATPAPDTDYSVRVCGHPVRPDAPRADAGARPRGDDAVRPAPAVAESAEPARDVTAITEKILADAGARISYLQGYIRTCQAQGFCDASPPR